MNSWNGFFSIGNSFFGLGTVLMGVLFSLFKSIFGAEVERLMLGEVEELWDMVAIATYPNRKAMLDMISDPDYIKSAQHRVAGLAGQLNIETKIK